MKPSFPGRAAGLLLLVLLGCERPFEPIQPNDSLFFSIYGYLDASADTQWVRVMPIRDLAETSPAPIDVTVRLERLGGGNAVSLRDSLFSFPASNIDLGIDRYARNFGTAERMEPGATYRVTATRSDGSSSSATARVPKDVPDAVVGIAQANVFGSGTGYLRLPGAEYLAMVNVIHRPPCGLAADTIPRAIYQALPSPSSRSETAIQVNIKREFYTNPTLFIGYPADCYKDELREKYRFRWWDIHFVLAGSPWPFDPGWSELEAFLEGAGSNVTNGTGFLGGVITRTIPFERCYLVGGASFAPFCELTYNARSASVGGFVRDPSCPNDSLPFDSTTVFVWEDNRQDVERATLVRDIQGGSITLRKPDGVRVRATRTDRDGSYRIDALEAGIPYAVSVVWSGHQSVENRLVPQAGQQLRLDMDLIRSNPRCRL